MPLRVTYTAATGEPVEKVFPAGTQAKVLASGVLKLSEQVEYEVPPLGKTDEKIVTKPEVVVAVFNCEYVLDKVG